MNALALATFAISLASAPLAKCATNGMDMSMDDAMTMTMGNMTAYLHFTPGDNLWFLGWATTTPKTMVGACVGLFMLAMFERWLAASRGMMEAYWARETLHVKNEASGTGTAARRSAWRLPFKLVPGAGEVPFVSGIDLVRGTTHAVQTAVGFALMLVVMTYQLAFIFSLAIGSFLGQVLFGRYARRAGGFAGVAGFGGH